MNAGSVHISVSMRMSKSIRMMAQLLHITNELLELVPESDRKCELMRDAYQVAKQMQAEMEFEPYPMGVIQ